MAYRSGQHGRLGIQRTGFSSAESFDEVGSVRNWSIDFQTEALDTTCLSDTDKTVYAGTRSFTGSGTVLYYEEDSSNFTKLTENMIATSNRTDVTSESFGSNADNSNGAYIKLELNLVGGGDGNDQVIKVFALMTSFNITCSTGEIVTANFQFTGHGAPAAFNYR